jgi:hypothetical protein
MKCESLRLCRYGFVQVLDLKEKSEKSSEKQARHEVEGESIDIYTT